MVLFAYFLCKFNVYKIDKAQGWIQKYIRIRSYVMATELFFYLNSLSFYAKNEGK